MAHRQQVAWYHSWAFIVIFIFFCFPVGLFALWTRTRANPEQRLDEGKTLTIGGSILLGFALLVAISSFSDGDVEGAEGVLILLGLPGAATVILGRMKEKKNVALRKYHDLIVRQNHHEIDDLSSLTTTDPHQVWEDIQGMLTDGLLPGYRLNPTTRMIEPVQSAQAPAAHQPAQAAPQVPAGPIDFTCKSCGVRNHVSGGGVAQCEYCDAVYSP